MLPHQKSGLNWVRGVMWSAARDQWSQKGNWQLQNLTEKLGSTHQRAREPSFDKTIPRVWFNKPAKKAKKKGTELIKQHNLMNVCLISGTKKEQHSTWWPNKEMTQV